MKNKVKFLKGPTAKYKLKLGRNFVESQVEEHSLK